MKKVLKTIGRILLIPVILAAVGLGVLTICEYRPEARETVIADHAADPVLSTGEELTAVTWNCGYGALGDYADFFMDGGESVYTADQNRVRQNLTGIRDTLTGLKEKLNLTRDPDLVLLQEVDINSARSYGTDERTILHEAMPDGTEAFAYEFNALYVPYPLPPIGHVESGHYTLSRADIREAQRISLPCPFAWPIRIANLKCCLLVSRIPLADTDRELVLINLHLQAYDDGAGKVAQTQLLLDLIQTEYNRGNYVIAGGDFNQRFSNVDGSAYPLYDGMWKPRLIEADEFGEDFSLLMDASVPSCRSLYKAYAGADKDRFQFYTIDGFIVSANVRVEDVKTLDEQFIYTDHNPVVLRFTLMPEREKTADPGVG